MERGNACQMESWSGRQSLDEAEKDRNGCFAILISGM